MHVAGEDVDLQVSVGESRRWLGGRGRNIPSFEIFTSPDWRGTNGWINFNQPLYRYGNLVKGIRLEFVDGRVTEASAEQNERVLTEMIATEGADRVGEFSLTDRRFSRITRFMAQTLYDENVGGEFGNTHIALGRAYQDAYDGDPSTLNGRGLGAARVQQLERPHRHRLDRPAHRHRRAWPAAPSASSTATASSCSTSREPDASARAAAARPDPGTSVPLAVHSSRQDRGHALAQLLVAAFAGRPSGAHLDEVAHLQRVLLQVIQLVFGRGPAGRVEVDGVLVALVAHAAQAVGLTRGRPAGRSRPGGRRR